MFLNHKLRLDKRLITNQKNQGLEIFSSKMYFFIKKNKYIIKEFIKNKPITIKPAF